MTSHGMLVFFLKYKYNCLLFTINIHYFIITHFIHNQSSAGILSYLYYLQFKKKRKECVYSLQVFRSFPSHCEEKMHFRTF